MCILWIDRSKLLKNLFKEMKEDKHFFFSNMTINFMCVFVFVNCIVVFWINVILGHPSNTLGPPHNPQLLPTTLCIVY